MAGSRHLARFRKELPYRPERLETLLSPLLEGTRPDGLAHTWVRADRLTVLPRLCEALGADLHSWCEVGLAAADLAVADMLDLALSLELGTLVIYDPSPQRANAVHVPLGADPVFQGTRRGLPWRWFRGLPGRGWMELLSVEWCRGGRRGGSRWGCLCPERRLQWGASTG